jgi:diguanylate cyclase (GGDEF)-like protein
MTRLINSVASLTDLRDRDELEVTLASVMFDLVGPSRLTLWRLVSYLGVIRLRQRAQVVVGSPIAVSDLQTEIKDLPALDFEVGLRACYESGLPLRMKPGRDGKHKHIFPISDGKSVLGLLQIDHSMPLREYQQRLIMGLLRIYRNHLSVLEDSECDQLTGLLNRKTFDEHFRQLMSPNVSQPLNTMQFEIIGDRRNGGGGHQAWLAVMDIDFFKRINDEFGHIYGDEILLLIARLMRNTFRDSDPLFRFGGEEFVAMFANADDEAAGQVLERCRATIADFAFPQVGRVTISIGYTCIAASDSGSDAFGRADQALYFAKQNGRNQVRCYETLVARGQLARKHHLVGEVELF